MNGLVAKVGKVYSDGGVVAVARRVISRISPSRADPYYQEKLAPANDLRWGMIRGAIPPGSRNLLDLGANLGELTARAADSGLWSVGIELSPDVVRKAQTRHYAKENCALSVGTVTPDRIGLFPRFDVILVLSVHHHWHKQYGADIAATMLRDLVVCAERAVIFEGPSRTMRYEKDLPEFEDNDTESVTSYYKSYLDSTVGDLVSDVTLIGKAACVGEREPFRWMFSLIK